MVLKFNSVFRLEQRIKQPVVVSRYIQAMITRQIFVNLPKYFVFLFRIYADLLKFIWDILLKRMF